MIDVNIFIVFIGNQILQSFVHCLAALAPRPTPASTLASADARPHHQTPGAGESVLVRVTIVHKGGLGRICGQDALGLFACESKSGKRGRDHSFFL